MRGPKPQPKPQATTPKLEAPKSLSPAARKEWRRVVALLEDSRILSELDTAALTIYCTSVVAYNEAQARVAVEGAVVLGGTTPFKNPWCSVMKEAWDRVRPLLAELGLTPIARARLKMGEGDELEALEV